MGRHVSSNNFRFLLELAWKRFLFKVCLIAHFFYKHIYLGRILSSHIFWQRFLFHYVLVFFFENRSVELSLQGVCGGNVSSNIFWVEISVEICAA